MELQKSSLSPPKLTLAKSTSISTARKNKEKIRSNLKEAKLNLQTKKSISSDEIFMTEEEKNSGVFLIKEGEFQQIYEEGEILGEGCAALVKLATRKSDGKEFAVKVVKTRDIETIINIKNEFLHHKQLSHPNIVRVFELFIEKNRGTMYSVMELVKSQEMFEVIHELGHYSEKVACKIFRQILEAIQYMHDNGICHRDLKPNNILSNQDGSEVKITDFNVSKFTEGYSKDHPLLQSEHIKMWTYTGTIAFSAPEMFTGEYNEAIDLWSAGVVLYTMLCGFEPFQAE